MNIAIYTITSTLHNEEAIAAATRLFLDSLNIEYDFRGENFSDYGSHTLSLIYVRTGGTEGIFRQLLPELQKRSSHPFYLLTSGKSNSLAASMEILSYLRQHQLQGEIIHGSVDYIKRRIDLLTQVASAKTRLKGCRLGVIGEPSDWLISSAADYERVKSLLGIELIDIPMKELLETLGSTPMTTPKESSETEKIQQALPGANQIYLALKQLTERYQLQGFTLRCFDLLSAVKNTGCLALAKLNSEGYVAGCEGDVPAMLSMMISRALTGVSGFQANPARINPETGEMLFAHCTIPGSVTLFKVSGNLSRNFIQEGELTDNQAQPDLCRTQQIIRLDAPSQTQYFLTNPIGNHHIIIPGRHKSALEEILKGLS